VDPDVKAALVALTEAHQRTDTQLAMLTQQVDGLADGVGGLNATMSVLASAQARTEERVEGLAATMNVLASAQVRTEERWGRLSDATLRGFTQATERHGEVIERLDRLESKQ
jgi:hypothetical protein